MGHEGDGRQLLLFPGTGQKPENNEQPD